MLAISLLESRFLILRRWLSRELRAEGYQQHRRLLFAVHFHHLAPYFSASQFDKHNILGFSWAMLATLLRSSQLLSASIVLGQFIPQ